VSGPHVAAARARRLVAVTLVALLAAGAPHAAAEVEAPPSPVIEQLPASWPPSPDLDAPVHLLVDAGTGQVLAESGADEPRPVASTIKILTALAAAQALDLDAEVEVGEEVVGVPGASVELAPGDRWTVRQLVAGILVRSGNDAAEALAVAAAGDREAFLELMTATAAELGVDLSGPLTTVSGLDDDQQLTATDLATLGRALLADAELRPLAGIPDVRLPGIGNDENRNLLVADYPGATGIKTGFTEAAGNSLVASAERDGRELVAVVLGGGEDPERFVDAAALLDHGFDAFAPTEVSGVRTLLVAGGTRELRVGATPVVVPTGAEAVVDLPVPVRAPEDDQLDVDLLVDGTTVATLEAAVTGEGAPPSGDEAQQLGRAAVDGVYAALRAAYDVERDR
jgi:serine-type D-Ala-D-Ala carboxypeptidase (penicillin-binding protein 5/6)